MSRSTAFERAKAQGEKFADEFAASLLMPAPIFTRLVSDGLNDRQLAIRFGVPVEAVRYRLHMLDLL